jgi:hypothetical protein
MATHTLPRKVAADIDLDYIEKLPSSAATAVFDPQQWQLCAAEGHPAHSSTLDSLGQRLMVCSDLFGPTPQINLLGCPKSSWTMAIPCDPALFRPN